MWYVYETDMTIPFSKQYKYVKLFLTNVTNYLHFYLHNNPLTAYYVS